MVAVVVALLEETERGGWALYEGPAWGLVVFEELEAVSIVQVEDD